MWAWLRPARAQRANEPASPPVANVFVSSTFLDMQAERDVLSRLVLPRLRERYAGRIAALREIDLRWGVTRLMSAQEGAVRICFDEVERSVPLVLGVIGHRVGWRPSLRFLQARHAQVLRDRRPDAGLTSLELHYALARSTAQDSLAPCVFLRSEAMSRRVVAQLRDAGVDITDDPEPAVRALREDAARSARGAPFVYDCIAEFEEKAERALDALLDQSLQRGAIRAAESPRPDEPELDRDGMLATLERASRRRPVLLFVEPGSGSTWLLQRWRERERERSVDYLDGRRTPIDELAPSAWDRGTRADGAAATPQAPGTITLVDHFEDAFATPHHADLTRLAERGAARIVVVASLPRIRAQADALGWQVVELAAPGRDALGDFAGRYLAAFGKTLEPHQLAQMTGAHWSARIGLLRLALDELRRFGSPEGLDAAIARLAAASTPAALCERIFGALSAVLEPRWAEAPSLIVAGLAMSRRGLEEETLCALAGSAEEPLPSSLWSALRMALGAALTSHAGRFDLAGGGVLAYALWWLDAAQGRRADLAQRLRRALAPHPPQRVREELPGIALLDGGVAGLQALLVAPEHVAALLEPGAAALEAWLNLLAPPAREHTFACWVAHVRSAGAAAHACAWPLGCLALKFDDRAAAHALFAMDAEHQPERPARTLLMALATGESAALHDAVETILAASGNPHRAATPDASLVLLLLGAIAARKLAVTREEAARIEATAAALPALSQRTAQAGHARLALGQLALLRLDLRRALDHFGRAESIGRETGDARLLLGALERKASAALERNAFRVAQASADECERLARQLGLFDFEALGLERLIEVAQRRADWTAAYTAAERYIERCRANGVDTQRARQVLDRLENPP